MPHGPGETSWMRQSPSDSLWEQERNTRKTWVLVDVAPDRFTKAVVFRTVSWLAISDPCHRTVTPSLDGSCQSNFRVSMGHTNVLQRLLTVHCKGCMSGPPPVRHPAIHRGLRWHCLTQPDG